MDGIAGETLSKVRPMLRQQYIDDLQRTTSSLYPFCRPVFPDEAEGYEDISELDDYMVVVNGLTWSIMEIPPCFKEEMKKKQQAFKSLMETCYNCGTEGYVCPIHEHPCMEV